MALIDKQKPDQTKFSESSECQIKKDDNGVRICAVHGKPLQQLTKTGDSLGTGVRQIRTWKCIDSGKTLMEIEGF
jgi:hypothetical protein